MVAPGKRPVDLSIDAREFHLVLKQAKEFDKKLYTNLRRDLRKAAEDAAVDVRREVLKPPRQVVKTVRFRFFHGRKVVEGAKVNFGRHELRKKIAKGVKIQISASESSRRVGVFIVSRGSDPASKMLKRSWDREQGWRHPVFADAANQERKEWTWVPQYGRPYFGSTISKRTPQIEAAVRKALTDTVNQLPKR